MVTQLNLFQPVTKPSYTNLRFNGPAYDKQHDQLRLGYQFERVFACMKDGKWRTLDEIAAHTGDPAASVSAQLRHARKPRFGGYLVNKRPRGDRAKGLWEYQLLVA